MENSDGQKSTFEGVNNNIDEPPQKNPNQQMSDRSATIRYNREERLKLLKERQNDDRLRKLEELKEHAQQAAKLREEQDSRRRKHFEELGKKEEERRRQAEEKRRMLDEERRNNLQSKWDTKKLILATKQNDKKPAYAFGSCTPRIIENVDGCLWKSQYNLNAPRVSTMKSTSAHDLHSQFLMTSSMSNWNQQRSTFDLVDSVGSINKNRRITGSAYRNTTQMDADRVFCGRRKTDLTPTLPIRRDNFSSRSASRAESSTGGARSGNVTPSRPPSSMTNSLMTSSTHSQIQVRPRMLGPRRLRPASVHVTGVSVENNGSKSDESSLISERTQKLKTERPAIKVDKSPKTSSPKNEVQIKPSRPSTLIKKTEKSELDSKDKSDASGPISKKNPSKPLLERIPGDTSTVRRVKPKMNQKESQQQTPKSTVSEVKSISEDVTKYDKTVPKENVVVRNIEATDIENNIEDKNVSIIQVNTENEKGTEKGHTEKNAATIGTHNPFDETNHVVNLLVDQTESLKDNIGEHNLSTGNLSQEEATTGANGFDENVESKSKILTQEEAKSALAEKRRLAREAQEREALRLEEEQKLEEERQRLEAEEEEERQRLEAEEAEKFALEARRSEEERLRRAIEEQEKRGAEEKRRREEEDQARLDRDREDREAAREAERVRLEMEERLKREEEERLERKRRVEAIMSRTRKKEGDAVNEKSAILQEDGDVSHDVKSSVNGIIHNPLVESSSTSNVNLNNFNNNMEFSDTLIDFGDIIQSSGNTNNTHSSNAGNNILSNPLQDLLS